MRQKLLRAFVGLWLLFFCVLAFPALPVQAAPAPPEVEAEAYVLMDAATGQVLASKNPHMAEYPASITKILTLGLVLEGAVEQPGKLAEPAPVSYRASHELIYGATHVGLREGDMLSVNDLVYATQIESANDAANVLAEYNDGSLEGFAGRMNTKAAELGLSGSSFVNPSGQPDANHYTTAYDMAAITRWAMGVPGFREVFSAMEYPLPPTASRDYVFTCQNNNPILSEGSAHYYPGVTGSKMGYTTDARYTLVTTAKRGETELICVVLHCETGEAKYLSTISLLDYGFGSFAPVTYPTQNVQPVAVPVYGGGKDVLGEIMVSGGEDVTFLLPVGMGLEGVSMECIVPEKYVIGQPFSPMLRFTASGEAGAEPIELVTVPMTWTGFDELFAANTPVWERAMQQSPVVLFLIVVVLLVVALVFGRVFYVKYRRYRRRQTRLAAALSRQPIRIEPRPEPARSSPQMARQSGITRARQMGMRSSKNHQPYVYGTSATQPRRAGRAR